MSKKSKKHKRKRLSTKDWIELILDAVIALASIIAAISSLK